MLLWHAIIYTIGFIKKIKWFNINYTVNVVHSMGGTIHKQVSPFKFNQMFASIDANRKNIEINMLFIRI